MPKLTPQRASLHAILPNAGPPAPLPCAPLPQAPLPGVTPASVGSASAAPQPTGAQR